jgi:predicted GIY-YIG superfamily endonuclease
MSFWVYILRCADDTYYTGHTENLIKRIEEHNVSYYNGYTSQRKPLKLVFSQMFPRRIDALKAEKMIKQWTRAKKEALINGDWERIQILSKKKFLKGT